MSYSTWRAVSLKEELLLDKIALDSEGIKIGRIVRVFSPFEAPDFENSTHVDIKPLRKKFSELAVKIELNKILHTDERCVKFDIKQEEFIERAVRMILEKEKKKKTAKQQAQLYRLKKQAEQIKKGYLNRRF